jgi:hypothetical protein
MLVDQSPAEHLGLVELDVRRCRALHPTGKQERSHRDAAFHSVASLLLCLFF